MGEEKTEHMHLYHKGNWDDAKNIQCSVDVLKLISISFLVLILVKFDLKICKKNDLVPRYKSPNLF